MKKPILLPLALIFAFGFTLVWADTDEVSTSAIQLAASQDNFDEANAGEVVQPEIIQPSVLPENSPAETKPAATPSPASCISFLELGFNFGKVKEGEIVQHDFIIKNTGNTDLCIYKVDVACVCTAALPVPQLIKPGGQGVLKVSLNTTRKFDGEYLEDINLYTNDPKNPFVKLMIKADITNSTASAAEKKQKEAPVLKTISPQDARELLKAKPDTILVDVRAPEEYSEGHIPSSILLPLDRISVDAPAILKDPDAVIIVYCRSGKRSLRAAQKLMDMGYHNVNDMGGILSWPYEVEK